MMIIVIALSLTQPAPCKRDTVAEHTTTDTWPIKAWRWQIEGIFCMEVLSPKNSNQFGTNGKKAASDQRPQLVMANLHKPNSGDNF